MFFRGSTVETLLLNEIVSNIYAPCGNFLKDFCFYCSRKYNKNVNDTAKTQLSLNQKYLNIFIIFIIEIKRVCLSFKTLSKKLDDIMVIRNRASFRFL